MNVVSGDGDVVVPSSSRWLLKDPIPFYAMNADLPSNEQPERLACFSIDINSAVNFARLKTRLPE
jgi:hypothetical protein